MYIIKLTVSSPDGALGDLTKSFDAASSWEALQKAIDEVKNLGFPEIHDIQIKE